MIEITRPYLSYQFLMNRFAYIKLKDKKQLQCKFCGDLLDTTYSYLINQLDEAGLLQPDFEPMCCTHFVLKRFGLLEKYTEIGSFGMKGEDLLITFKNDQKIWIHDYKKYLSGEKKIKEECCANCKQYSFKNHSCPHGYTVVPYNVCCDKFEPKEEAKK